MLYEGFKWLTLTDPQQGEVKLLVPLPTRDDPWGALAPLRDTSWGQLIPVVSGSAMSDAVHGWATGLMRVIGPEPRHLQRGVGDWYCALHEACLIAAPHCRPSTDLPDCYEAPHDDPEVGRLASLVALAWREDRYVIVVEGREWSLS